LTQRPRHVDVIIRGGSLCILSTVKPVSSRAKIWFGKNFGSEAEQCVYGDKRGELKASFEALGFVMWWNPPVGPETLRLVRIADERLQQIKRRKIH